jgi:ribosome-associated toxin RatA of RatAB toxin-antitoxin module
MKTSNRITVVGSIDEAYGLVEDVSRWPAIDQAVGDVKILRIDGRAKMVELSTRGGSLPVKITCVQLADPVERRVIFRYVDGLMKGVVSEWTFSEVKLNHKGLVQVSVTNDFSGVSAMRAYIVNRLFSNKRTEMLLERLKEIVEAGFLAKVLLLGEDFFNEKMDWSAAAMLENESVVVKVY